MYIPAVRVAILGNKLCLLKRYRVTSNSHIDRGTEGTAFQYKKFYLSLFCNSRQNRETSSGIWSHGGIDKSRRRPSQLDEWHIDQRLGLNLSWQRPLKNVCEVTPVDCVQSHQKAELHFVGSHLKLGTCENILHQRSETQEPLEL
jgi:hypothetical protein